MAVLLLSSVFPPQVGGNGHWMYELYSRMPRGEYVVVSNKTDGCEAFDSRQLLPIIRMQLSVGSWGVLNWSRGFAYYRILEQLSRIVRERAIECVHASNCLPEGFLAWLLHRRFGLPYLVYVHGEELNIAGSSRELTWMANRVYRNAAVIVANSRNSARVLESNWPVVPERVHVMHPGVDTKGFRPAPVDSAVRRRFGWGDRPVILSVGRLQQRKGQAEVIRAMPEILRHIPNALYAIVGDGDDRTRLEQLVAELGLGKFVTLHGELPPDDLLCAYQQCDVFVLANRVVNGDFEGFGIVFLEAQACGKPVVGGDSGGAPEAIDAPDSGRIVRQECPQELAGTLVELLADNDLRERLGDAGRRWAETHFDWDVLVKQASQIFSSSPHGVAARQDETAVAGSA